MIKKFDFMFEQSCKGTIQSFIYLSNSRENSVLIE